MTFLSYLTNSCFEVYLVGFCMHFKERKFNTIYINHSSVKVNIREKRMPQILLRNKVLKQTNKQTKLKYSSVYRILI